MWDITLSVRPMRWSAAGLVSGKGGGAPVEGQVTSGTFLLALWHLVAAFETAVETTNQCRRRRADRTTRGRVDNTRIGSLIGSE
jgi:hypothetical protein